ncbi:MAG: hypothetical protein WKF79_12420 [Nocardioides sp.]
MNDWVMGVVLGLSVVACLGLVVLLVRDRLAGDVVFGFLAVLEVVLLVQLVLGAVALAGTSREVSGVLFVSYLVGVLLALPVGVFWSLAERTRAGTAVLLAAALTVIGLELRLDVIWGGTGA